MTGDRTRVQNHRQRQARLSLSGLILILAIVLFGPARDVRADDRFVLGERHTVGVVQLGDHKQLVQWIGPTVGDAAWPQIDEDLNTTIVLRVVPNGMPFLRKALTQTRVDGVALRGAGLTDGDFESLVASRSHLKTLMIASFNSLPPEELSDLTEQERSDLGNASLSPTALELIARLPDLETLAIRGYRLPPSRLQFLSGLNKLSRLEISDSDVTDEDLKSLANLSQLETLNLAGTQVTGGCLEHLRGCRQLRNLSLEDTQCGDALAAEFDEHGWPQLSAVYVGGCDMSADGVNALRDALPFTTVLDDDHSINKLMPLSADDAHAIRQYRSFVTSLAFFGGARMKFEEHRLQNLGFHPKRIPPRDSMKSLLAQVALLGDLTKLSLSHCEISDEAFDQLQSMDGLERLQTLSLSHSSVGDEAMKTVAALPGLKELTLTGTHVGDAGVQELSQLQNLEALSLEGTKITNEALEAIAALPRLRALSLEDTQITDEGARHLLEAARLELIDLSGTATSGALRYKLYRHLKAVQNASKDRTSS